MLILSSSFVIGTTFTKISAMSSKVTVTLFLLDTVSTFVSSASEYHAHRGFCGIPISFPLVSENQTINLIIPSLGSCCFQGEGLGVEEDSECLHPCGVSGSTGWSMACVLNFDPESR